MLLGVLFGLSLRYLLLLAGQPIIERRFGIFIENGGQFAYEWMLLGAGIEVQSCVRGFSRPLPF